MQSHTHVIDYLGWPVSFAGLFSCVQAFLGVQAYDIPYQAEPEANMALYETMDKLDWKQLLARVDEGYRTWRKDSVVLYGNKVCSPE